MKDTRKVLRLDFAVVPWQPRSYAPAPKKKTAPTFDLSPRIELSLAVVAEADSEIPEPTEN